MKKSLLALAATTCCAISTLAYASLGGSVSTVSADQLRLVANHQAVNQQATAGAAYTVSEMVLPSTTVVREYVAAGKVFAVTWSGPSAPNGARQLQCPACCLTKECYPTDCCRFAFFLLFFRGLPGAERPAPAG
ncbi:DUF2844 domain-containing protein, partial [Paraburkholderia phenoliruptrix]